VHTRRRGEELQRAIYGATVAELIASNYGGLTMEGIAARARCGKAALYRQSPDKRKLLLDALRSQLPPLPVARPNLTARQNLSAALRSLADLVAGKAKYPSLFVIAQLMHDPETRAMYADSVVVPRMKAIDAIITAGVQSGEIDRGAITALTTRTGSALIIQQLQLTGKPPTQLELESIVDALIGPPRLDHDQSTVAGKMDNDDYPRVPIETSCAAGS
jgi:AcrR family transcriptional regulator